MIRRLIPRPVKRILQGTFDTMDGWLEPLLAKARKNLLGLWRQDNLWEPAVGVSLRDLCKPGAVVFDCGANIGGLTILMSRLVGPRGIVCAFEASPRVIDKCQRNLVHNGCFNTTLYHAAIFAKSNELIPLAFGDNYQGDSIHGTGKSRPGCLVPTLAVDDFVQRHHLLPDLIKMDIEGAEYDALLGMPDTLQRGRPHLILETQPEDTRCLELLRALGYRAIDLNNYREIRGPQDYPPGVQVRNLLYIHQERLTASHYVLPVPVEESACLSAEAFQSLKDGSLRQRKPLVLNPGRYVFTVDASALQTNNEMKCGIRSEGKDLLFYQASTQNLFCNCRDWVLCLRQATPVEVYFDFLWRTHDPSFQFHQVVVTQIKSFDAREPPLVL